MALPPVIPSTQDAGSWMQHQTTMLGPVGYAAPPSPHAPAADNEPERAALIASLRELLEASERRAQRLTAELQLQAAELKEARDEARDAKFAELRCEHKFAELRCEQKYNDWWRGAKWRSSWWSS